MKVLCHREGLLSAFQLASVVVPARDLTQRALQLRFDGSAVRLLLPAGEVRPVVLQHDLDIQFLMPL